MKYTVNTRTAAGSGTTSVAHVFNTKREAMVFIERLPKVSFVQKVDVRTWSVTHA